MTTYAVYNACPWHKQGDDALVEAMDPWAARKKLREYLEARGRPVNEDDWNVRRIVDDVRIGVWVDHELDGASLCHG